MNADPSQPGRQLQVWPDLAVVWMLALAVPTISSAAHLLAGGGDIELTDRSLYHTVVFELLSLGAVAAYLKWRGRLRDLISFKMSVLGTALGLLLLIGSYWLTDMAAWGTILACGNPKIFSGFKFIEHGSHMAVLTLCLVNPIFEELVVTGCVMGILERHGASVAIATSTFLRLAYHTYQGPISAVSILPTGLLFASFFWLKRDLWPLIVAHMFLDLIPMLSR